MRKNNLIKNIKIKVFGCFFAVLIMLSSIFGITPGLIENAYAEPGEETTVTTNAGKSCEDSLGSLGWLVCPTTGKISEAVDFLYDKIEDVLEINPVEAKDGSPVYEIWKYFQGVTNILFIIFCSEDVVGGIVDPHPHPQGHTCIPELVHMTIFGKKHLCECN